MKIDFRTKFILTFIIGIVSIEGSVGQKYPVLGILVAIFPYILAIGDKRWSLLIKGLFYTGLAIMLKNYLLNYNDNIIAMIFNLYSGIVIRIIPGVIMGYYTITTTKMSDLVYSLKKIHFPDAIIIPISVMFRFFYSIKEDYKKIGEAMYMHDLTYKSFFKNPKRILEYKFVPLLMITSQTADNVAVSAMTRGMIIGSKRSSISNARLKICDYLLILFAIALFIIFIKVKIC